MDDKGRTPIDFWVRGQRSRSNLPPYEGFHALCCLVKKNYSFFSTYLAFLTHLLSGGTKVNDIHVGLLVTTYYIG